MATRRLEIPCGGSHHWRLMDMFAPAEYAQVERAGYVLVRDTTCRLFGYHGLVRRNGAAFSLDHMFGF